MNAQPIHASVAEDIDPSLYDTMDSEAGTPAAWLYDPDGRVLRLSPRCVGFQVRYWPPHSRGMGELVIDDHTGLPLFVPRAASPEDFREAVGYREGRYRLFPVDDTYERLRHMPAQVSITAKMVAARRASAAPSELAEPNANSAAGTATTHLVGQFLSLQSEQFKAVLAQQTQVLSQQVHQIDTISAQVGRLTEAVAGILTSAGSSGLFTAAPPTASLIAVAPAVATTAGVSPPRSPTSAATATPVAEPPRNGGATPASATELAKPNETEATTPADMALRVLETFIGPIGKVGAAKLGKLVGLSMDEIAQLLGTSPPPASDAAADALAQATSKAADATHDTAAPDPGASAAAASGLTGDALAAHFDAIRKHLSDEDTRTLIPLALRHRERMDDLKAIVGRMDVERAINVTRKLLAVWRALAAPEQDFVSSLIANPRAGFAGVVSLVEERTVPNAITVIRNTMERARAAA